MQDHGSFWSFDSFTEFLKKTTKPGVYLHEVSISGVITVKQIMPEGVSAEVGWWDKELGVGCLLKNPEDSQDMDDWTEMQYDIFNSENP